MSSELALDSLGANITAASSCDLQYPPSAIIDGKPNTFWLTTGTFPQEFVLQLGETSTIKTVELVSSGLRNIELYKTDGTHASSWEKVSNSEADDADGDIQRLSLQIPSRLTATFLRVRVSSLCLCFDFKMFEE